MSDESQEIERLRQRADRERRAREAAEAAAEQGTRLLYERQQQLQLLNAVADAANGATSVDAVIQVALDHICAYTGWPVGHAYFVTEDTIHPLVPTSLWHLDDAGQFAIFRQVTESTRFRCGEGLPGRVLESGGPVWVADVTQDDNFPSAQQAVEIGVRGAFAIPVRVGGNVVAVLEFFSRESAEPERTWLEVTAQVATQVGRTFERERARKELERMHHDLLEASRAAGRAQDEAERANRAKSEFLSGMSHELRTPLNAILGFAQVMEMDDPPPQYRVPIGHILKGGRHLLDLINEVLDIAKIEAGRMSISVEPVPLRKVVEECVALIRPLADQRSIRIDNTLPADDEQHVLADRQRLKQALLNLLSNAVKFNRDGGSVKLWCEEGDIAEADPASEDAHPEPRLRLHIADTGYGIPAAELPRLFEPFERLSAYRRGIEGTGLGLALTRRLLELMGASVRVESDENRGSVFSIDFRAAQSPVPRQPPSLPSGAAEAAVQIGAHTLLYIEDNLSNLQLIEHVLAHRPGIKLLAAMQGSLGLDIAREHRPRLILLDLNLPDIPGREVLRRLRGEDSTRDIPVVIISADATPGEIQRMLAAGAAHYLTKPLDLPKFLAVMDEHLADENVR